MITLVQLEKPSTRPNPNVESTYNCDTDITALYAVLQSSLVTVLKEVAKAKQINQKLRKSIQPKPQKSPPMQPTVAKLTLIPKALTANSFAINKNIVWFIIYIDRNYSNWSLKQKIFHLADKHLLHNMAASSGLRENVYPIIFSLKMFIFIILLLLLLISTDVKSY